MMMMIEKYIKEENWEVVQLELERISKGRLSVAIKSVCVRCNEIIEGSCMIRKGDTKDEMKNGEYHNGCFLKTYKETFKEDWEL